LLPAAAVIMLTKAVKPSTVVKLTLGFELNEELTLAIAGVVVYGLADE
jgi:hypothetical protein